MKILLIGEYSNVHNTLKAGLERLGHKVVVASNGDYWKAYPRDIDLARPSGRLAGLRLTLHLFANLHKLRGYDIVQIINPVFIDLKAKRIQYIYNYLRRHNKKIIMGAFGMDYYWVHVNSSTMPLRYSDFNIGKTLRTNKDAIIEQRDWVGTDKEQLNKTIANDCDGIVAGLYEYQVCYQPFFPDKTTFIPFPIITEGKKTQAERKDGALKLFIGISKNRSEYKGTDIMLRAAKAVKAEYPELLELRIAEGIPFDEYVKLMEGSDAILDQLYSYTPSMNPLEAMSRGIICIGGGEPENYEILNETQLRPIINVQPTYESCYEQIKLLALHPERIPQLQQESIDYIRKHHDHIKVAKQYETFYNTILAK